mgnify:FL=1
MKEENQSVRRVKIRTLILFVLMTTGVGTIVLLQSKDSPFNPSRKPPIGKGVPAPNFSLPDLEGKKVSLTDFKGKVVLLNIWATWCAPCVAEMPSMENLYQELKHEDFELLAISIDESGAEAVKPFLEKHKLGFPVLLDTTGKIKNLYRTTGVPESFIIDKDGMIVEKIIGPRDWAASEAIRYFRNIIQSN